MSFDVVMGIIRHVLTFGGGYLVTAGYLDSTNAETAVGAVATLIGLGWSIYHKVAVKKPA